MLGAGADVSIPTFFTLELLGQLARQARFGRALPPQEQIFLVVTDSVLKQLDGLKNDAAARPVIRRFLGQGLDTYGPAGVLSVTRMHASAAWRGCKGPWEGPLQWCALPPC
jgi:hypothetical protein